jgi:hypothetical protein
LPPRYSNACGPAGASTLFGVCSNDIFGRPCITELRSSRAARASPSQAMASTRPGWLPRAHRRPLQGVDRSQMRALSIVRPRRIPPPESTRKTRVGSVDGRQPSLIRRYRSRLASGVAEQMSRSETVGMLHWTHLRPAVRGDGGGWCCSASSVLWPHFKRRRRRHRRLR